MLMMDNGDHAASMQVVIAKHVTRTAQNVSPRVHNGDTRNSDTAAACNEKQDLKKELEQMDDYAIFEWFCCDQVTQDMVDAAVDELDLELDL